MNGGNDNDGNADDEFESKRIDDFDLSGNKNFDGGRYVEMLDGGVHLRQTEVAEYESAGIHACPRSTPELKLNARCKAISLTPWLLAQCSNERYDGKPFQRFFGAGYRRNR